MKEFLIQIPEQKEAFLRELLEQLGITAIEHNLTIPKQHQDLVNERIQTEKEHTFVPWSEVQNLFKQ